MACPSYSVHFQDGFSKPVRFRRGEGVNLWGLKLNECAQKLDAMDLPEEAVAVLRELFEEFGQQYRDLSELRCQDQRDSASGALQSRPYAGRVI